MKAPVERFRSIAGAAAVAIGLTFLIFYPGWTTELSLPPSSSNAELARHVRYLASPELMGRGIDTPGLELARDYIAQQFKHYGLAPGGDNGTYFQSLDVVSGVAVNASSELRLDDDRPLSLSDDWQPLGFSRSGTVEGDVVFAGYGITAKDYDYDDYTGLDVNGKIVLVLRYEPPPKDEHSPFGKRPRYSSHATFRAKARNARDHGAVGMLLVDLDPDRGGDRELIPARRSLGRGETGLVAAQISRSAAERWLKTKDLSLAAIKESIDREEKPASRALVGTRVFLNVSLQKTTKRTDNIVGILPGGEIGMKPENIVVGAHYDHLGLGRYGARNSSSEGQIHYGADDNASGTAVVLELARRLSVREKRFPRPIVFALFTGEELGLYGSRHYVAHPPFPIASTTAMINLDMVGRLENNRVTVSGIDTARELRSILEEAAKKSGVEIRPSSRNRGKSDHASFHDKRVPALHFFTGVHKDYHRPTDTWEKLNIEGMEKIVDLVVATLEGLSSNTEPLAFVPSPVSSAPPEARDGYGSYLGTIPDFGDVEQGVRLAGVQEGSPAAGAGLTEGDVIIQLAEIKISSLEDLASALRAKKPGEEVDILVLRNGKRLLLKAVLKSRS